MDTEFPTAMVLLFFHRERVLLQEWVGGTGSDLYMNGWEG